MNCENEETNEGFIQCDECKGEGATKDNSLCYKCYGAGKLTWIENIFGKKHIVGSSGFYGYTGSSGFSGMSGVSIYVPTNSLPNGSINTYNIGDIVYDNLQHELHTCTEINKLEKIEVEDQKKNKKKDHISTLVIKELVSDIKNFLVGKDN